MPRFGGDANDHRRCRAASASPGADLGKVLDAVRAYERADLHMLEKLRPGELARFLQVYRDAAAWAQELLNQLNAG